MKDLGKGSVLDDGAGRPGNPAVAWLQGTERTDWLFDGYKPPSEEIWQRLVWDQAYVDMGPSVAGNLGPYWHVPLRDEDGQIDTVHRLYPKLLNTKWLLIVRRACEEYAGSDWKRRSDDWKELCQRSTPVVAAARRLIDARPNAEAELRAALADHDAASVAS